MAQRKLNTILITGAGGFGRVLAREARAMGYHVVLTTRNDLTRAQALAADPELKPQDIITIDYTDEKARKPAFWGDVLRAHGIDGVINSAMISPKAKPRVDKVPDVAAIVNTEVPKAIFAAAEQSDVPVVQQSSLHAHIYNDEADTYRHTKDATRKALQERVASGKLKAVVAELGVVTEPDNGHYLMEVMASLPVEVQPVTQGKVQPIDARDAAQGMVGMLDNLAQERWDVVRNGKVYQGGGSKAMTWPEYFQDFREAMGIGDRKSLKVPMPLNQLSEFMLEVNSKLPVQIAGNSDGYDIKEMRRDFTVSDAERDAFMQAGNLAELRAPSAAYTEWVEQGNHPPKGLAAILAYMGVEPKKNVWQRDASVRVNPADFPPATKGNVLVTGATGFVGPAVVEELARQGYKVVCGVRNIEKAKREISFPNVEFMRVDMNEDLDVETWRARLVGHDITAIVNNAGVASTPFGEQFIDNVNHHAPKALFTAAESLNRERGHKMQEGIRAIQVSSTGVYWPDCQEHDYPRTKLALDNDLQQMRGLNYTIVRPNIVLEPGRGHLPVEKLVSFPMIPHTGDGEIQPINNRELAIGIARLVDVKSPARQTVLDACGPQKMSWKDLFHDIRRSLHRKPTVAPSVPIWLASKTMAVMHKTIPDQFHKKLGMFAKLDKDTIIMVSRGSTRDASAWQKATGVTPSSLVDAYVAYLDSPETYRAYVDNLRAETPVERKSRFGGFVARLAEAQGDAKQEGVSR
jgi:nucleoside-diphosphate-sugar epimerase